MFLLSSRVKESTGNLFKPNYRKSCHPLSFSIPSTSLSIWSPTPSSAFTHLATGFPNYAGFFVGCEQISELSQPLEPTGTRSTDPKAPVSQQSCWLYLTFRRSRFKFDQLHGIGLYLHEHYIICCPVQSSWTDQHLHPSSTFDVPVVEFRFRSFRSSSLIKQLRLLNHWNPPPRRSLKI